MNALSEVVVQCLAVKRMLLEFKCCVQDDYFAEVLSASIRTLDVYQLELHPWAKAPRPSSSRALTTNNFVDAYGRVDIRRLAEVCRLRLELLDESLHDALRAPLSGSLRHQLLYYKHEYSDIKAMVECILAAVLEAKDEPLAQRLLPTFPNYNSAQLSA